MVQVGALGELAFQAGWHIYIGSALGSGGLCRLERHISLARLRNKRPKWHVDYLLTNPEFTLVYAISAGTKNRLECHLAHALGGNSVPGFGCSDCRCTSHLVYRYCDPEEEILATFRSLQLVPVTKTIMSPRVEGYI